MRLDGKIRMLGGMRWLDGKLGVELGGKMSKLGEEQELLGLRLACKQDEELA